MPVKLIMTWNILPNHEQEYFDFLVREFVPSLNRLGFELSDAWATIYGNQPQVLISAILPNELEAEERMAKPEWLDLLDKLQRFIQDFELKLAPVKSGFQF